MDSTASTDTPPPPLRERRWHAGALTYTFGGLVALFFWLLWGDFALNLKERSIPDALKLLLKHFEASDRTLGWLATSLPALMAVIVAPVVSYHSDRLRSRWGRRIPFLIVTAPIAFAATAGLAYSPVIGRWLAHALGAQSENAAVVASFGVFWAIFELCSTVVASVVLPGLINDVVPRPVLGRFFGMFRVVSLGAGMLFQWFLMGKVETYYVPIFLGIGALYAVSFTLMCFTVKESVAPAPEPNPAELAELESQAAPAVSALAAFGSTPAAAMLEEISPSTRAQRLGDATKTYLRESFGIPYYFWFFGSFALANMAFAPINSFSIPFCLALGMDRGIYGKLSTVQFFLSMVQAYPVGWLCDRFHPLRITMVSMGLYALVTLLAFCFVRTPFTFGIAHIICGTCAGFWITATAPLGPALLPRARFAQFLSATQICIALGMAAIAPACGWFLDRHNHDYRYMYLWACVLVTGSLVVTAGLYSRFMARGGPMRYAAPE